MRATEEIKPTAIDLFSGCGGLTWGLKAAGFKVVAAIESDPRVAETYQLNHADVRLVRQDIRRVSAAKLMQDLKLKKGDLTLLAGCPPCQGFSVLRTHNGGKRNADRRNLLAKDFLRFVKRFRPKAVTFENVPALAHKRAFATFCRSLRALGYNVHWDIKDAQFYGVPQRRKRLVLLAGRGFDVDFARPCRSCPTVRDAIGNLARPGRSGDRIHDFPEKRSGRIRRRIAFVPKNGGSRSALPYFIKPLACHSKCDGFKDVYGRMAWNKVAPTITCGCFNPSKGRFIHPTQNRAITMREAALLQGLPRSFRVPRHIAKTEIAAMVGNALPPEFIRRHAVKIRNAVLLNEKEALRGRRF